MRSLLDLDKVQLNRIEQALTALGARPAAEREKKISLRLALESERKELIRCNPAIRSTSRFKAAA